MRERGREVWCGVSHMYKREMAGWSARFLWSIFPVAFSFVDCILGEMCGYVIIANGMNTTKFQYLHRKSRSSRRHV